MANKIYNILTVQPTHEYHVLVKFEDGLEKDIDLKTFIGKGVSASLANPEYFKKVKVDFGTLVWDNGYELCPVTLRNYLQ